jgi:tetratricopeptide (TPR) repeat protein
MESTAYRDYAQAVEQVVQLVQHEQYETAIKALEKIVLLDISATDKAMMCLNMATVYGKLNRHDEALAWYDKGTSYERGAGGTFVSERRAGYLAEQGRYRESLVRYQELLSHPGLSEGDKQRIGQNIDLLLQRV